jgi:LAO/AO transport system kinase
LQALKSYPTISEIKAGDIKAISRALSLIENNTPQSKEILHALDFNSHIPVIGFTGAPGAGKSSLVNALVGLWLQKGYKVAVLAVDPSSPFNFGSLLGDRIRLAEHFLNDHLFMRSVSTRGSLGGLSAHILEMADLLRNAGFDKIIIETVGVGQSEVEIAGVADITIVVTVPEGGDEVQAMKSGVMEIADIFVLNKSDRPGADSFYKNLQELTHAQSSNKQTPIVKTVATENIGIEQLRQSIDSTLLAKDISPRKYLLLAEKIQHLVMRDKMKTFNLKKVAAEIESASKNKGFNIYQFSKQYI